MKKYLCALFLLLSIPAYALENFNVSELEAVKDTDQIIIVSVIKGSSANLAFYQQNYDSGEWSKLLDTSAFIGKNGLGKTREGDSKTPIGLFHFTQAFGIKKDPGCAFGDYLKVDGSHYWVGDSKSDRYNQMVTTREYKQFNRHDSEHIIDYVPQYNYAMNISYNENGTPKKGSAIFLHCKGSKPYTGGCVSIGEEDMKFIIQNVKPNCKIIIDFVKNIGGY